jgi:hypothetical protein
LYLMRAMRRQKRHNRGTEKREGFERQGTTASASPTGQRIA